MSNKTLKMKVKRVDVIFDLSFRKCNGLKLKVGQFPSPLPQGAEESCLTVMLAQFIAQIDLVIQNNERD